MKGKREHLCQYGSCAVYGSPLPVAVTVSLDWPDAKETVRFCSERHAAAWLTNQADRLERGRQGRTERNQPNEN